MAAAVRFPFQALPETTISSATVETVRRAIAEDAERRELQLSQRLEGKRRAKAAQRAKAAELAECKALAAPAAAAESAELLAAVRSARTAEREMQRAAAAHAESERELAVEDAKRRAAEWQQVAHEMRRQRHEAAQARVEAAEAQRVAEVEEVRRRMAAFRQRRVQAAQAAARQRSEVRAAADERRQAAVQVRRERQKALESALEDSEARRTAEVKEVLRRVAADAERRRIAAEAAEAERRAAAEAAEARRRAAEAERRAAALVKWRAAHPGQIIVSGIMARDLPDADKRAGSGVSDPYVRFIIESPMGGGEPAGGAVSVRTETKANDRNPSWEGVALTLEVPHDFGLGGTPGRMRVCVWDDDSFDDGIKEDDALGVVTIEVSREGGAFDQLIDGQGALRAFHLGFRYEAIFLPEPPELLPLPPDP